ncbi:hypothetical protein C5167_014736, partial [Papaver somniferum]
DLTVGTTIITTNDELGTLIAADGQGNSVSGAEDIARLGLSSTTDELKVAKIQFGLYASVAGFNGWTLPLIEEFKNLGKTPKLNIEDCATLAKKFFLNRKYKLNPDKWSYLPENFDIQRKAASITFSSYGGFGENPRRVIKVQRYTNGFVTKKDVLRVSELKTKLVPEMKKCFRTFSFQGSGGDYARKVLCSKSRVFECGKNVRRRLDEILKAMAYSCFKDPKTGRMITVFHLTDDGTEVLYEKNADVLMHKYRDFLTEMEIKEEGRVERVEVMNYHLMLARANIQMRREAEEAAVEAAAVQVSLKRKRDTKE